MDTLQGASKKKLRGPTAKRSVLPLALCLTLACFSSSLQSQPDSINIQQSQIEAASAALVTLDDKAASCLEAIEAGSSEQVTVSCDEFLKALDGDELATYLQQCQLLKEWRNTFLEDTLGKPSTDAESNLQLLLGIEYNCGENAMQRRTAYVTDAFNSLYGKSSLTESTESSINQRFAESQFENQLNYQRQLLQQSIQQQQSHRLDQTQQQFNDLENELIRQQLPN